MSHDYLRSRLLGVTAVASEYCLALENAREFSREEFLAAVASALPKLYLDFSDIIPAREESPVSSGDGEDSMIPLGEMPEDMELFSSYVDEDYYESVRRNVETLLGPDDTFLETFEEDMKYSDTPIAASVSESLADIFQPLYNFISEVKDSDGENLIPAYLQCREEFVEYWSQTLCNVMRPINHLRFG